MDNNKAEKEATPYMTKRRKQIASKLRIRCESQSIPQLLQLAGSDSGSLEVTSSREWCCLANTAEQVDYDSSHSKVHQWAIVAFIDS